MAIHVLRKGSIYRTGVLLQTKTNLYFYRMWYGIKTISSYQTPSPSISWHYFNPKSQLLKSYLTDHYFRVKQGEEYSGLKPIKAAVPQGSVLGPVLYLIFTSDIPQPEGTTVVTFADDSHHGSRSQRGRSHRKITTSSWHNKQLD